MNFKWMRTVCAFLLVFVFFGGNTMAQDSNGTLGSVDPAAMQTYTEALQNMDQQNANNDVQLLITMPMGKLTLEGNIEYQKNPLLVKNDIKAQFLTKENKVFPVFATTQYMQADGNGLLIYSSNGQQGKKKKWYLRKVPLTDPFKQNLLLLPASEEYSQHVQNLTTAVKEVYVESEDDSTQHLRVVFDNKKLFDTNIAAFFSEMDPTLSGADKAGMTEVLNNLITMLQNSSDVSGTIDIDKSTHKIVTADFDLSDQIKILARSAYTSLIPTPTPFKSDDEAIFTEDNKVASKVADSKVINATADNNVANINTNDKAANAVADSKVVNANADNKAASADADNKVADSKAINATADNDAANADAKNKAAGTDAENALLNNKEAIENLINNSTAHIIINVKPVDNIMDLAIPQNVRDSAVELKMGGALSKAK
ncbi:hypothetical protein [Pectinatus cerevisiiphilus]|uniref:Uncharacterized protein n=1 Tax=Pectinatus cerevisiiphilus TaxID=86956 RepID=A0A4V2USM8_9FIRM|nr:hypothetical protein [Pectinatus cerevisiiphilus]TCS82032.1 hypothetical protein EDC37_101204 [Pectinatus cerevisiiphilus]